MDSTRLVANLQIAFHCCIVSRSVGFGIVKQLTILVVDDDDSLLCFVSVSAFLFYRNGPFVCFDLVLCFFFFCFYSFFLDIGKRDKAEVKKEIE